MRRREMKIGREVYDKDFRVVWGRGTIVDFKKGDVVVVSFINRLGGRISYGQKEFKYIKRMPKSGRFRIYDEKS